MNGMRSMSGCGITGSSHSLTSLHSGAREADIVRAQYLVRRDSRGEALVAELDGQDLDANWKE